MLNLVRYLLLPAVFATTFCLSQRVAAQTPYGSTERRYIYVEKHSKHFSYLESNHQTYPAWWDDCVITNNYTIAQRLQRYPFNKAAKIVVVSYPGAVPDPPDPLTPPLDYHYKGLFVENGTLDLCDINEMRELDQGQINRLTSIIYNIAYKKTPKFGERQPDPGCKCFYAPELAILFYNKNGKIFDYMEFDFRLEEFTSKSDRLRIGPGCNQKLDFFRRWFKSIGIHQGIHKFQEGDNEAGDPNTFN